LEQSSKQLYNNLMALCEPEDSPFSFKDHEMLGDTYRIFNYRIATYTDFCKPDALECRGIMFRMILGAPVCISSRPPKKFFNLNENPFTLNINPHSIVEFMVKEDGSLISSYIVGDGSLGLKSKASLNSDQAIAAMTWLKHPDNFDFCEEVIELTLSGYTVNMEWVAPENRIVLPYQRPALVVLNIRNNETGLTLYWDQTYGKPDLPWVKAEPAYDGEFAARFLNEIPAMVDIEGFVARLDNGDLVKIKTDWYLHLHLTKDSIVIPRRLFECVVTEASDDLKSLFSTDPWALNKIKEMEDFVKPKFNHMVSVVESYYSENKDLSRKDYAIKGQKELGPYFSLGMDRYLVEQGIRRSGPDYKEFAIKNYKTFGVSDEETVREE
jgi:T4 RnlA family RNA ligase